MLHAFLKHALIVYHPTFCFVKKFFIYFFIFLFFPLLDKNGARNQNRTDTGLTTHRILSPVGCETRVSSILIPGTIFV